jgi:hypothetical protein
VKQTVAFGVLTGLTSLFDHRNQIVDCGFSVSRRSSHPNEFHNVLERRLFNPLKQPIRGMDRADHFGLTVLALKQKSFVLAVDQVSGGALWASDHCWKFALAHSRTLSPVSLVCWFFGRFLPISLYVVSRASIGVLA